MRVAACKSGLPFEAAFTADEDFLMAWLVASGEHEGSSFDWSAMQWRKPK